jgi:hypothetical protein
MLTENQCMAMKVGGCIHENNAEQASTVHVHGDEDDD